MSIQASFNQAVSVAEMLYTQTPQFKTKQAVRQINAETKSKEKGLDSVQKNFDYVLDALKPLAHDRITREAVLDVRKNYDLYFQEEKEQLFKDAIKRKAEAGDVGAIANQRMNETIDRYDIHDALIKARAALEQAKTQKRQKSAWKNPIFELDYNEKEGDK